MDSFSQEPPAGPQAERLGLDTVDMIREHVAFWEALEAGYEAEEWCSRPELYLGGRVLLDWHLVIEFPDGWFD